MKGFMEHFMDAKEQTILHLINLELIEVDLSRAIQFSLSMTFIYVIKSKDESFFQAERKDKVHEMDRITIVHTKCFQ